MGSRDAMLAQTALILWIAAVVFFIGGVPTWAAMTVGVAVVASVWLARRWRRSDA